MQELLESLASQRPVDCLEEWYERRPRTTRYDQWLSPLLNRCIAVLTIMLSKVDGLSSVSLSQMK